MCELICIGWKIFLNKSNLFKMCVYYFGHLGVFWILHFQIANWIQFGLIVNFVFQIDLEFVSFFYFAFWICKKKKKTRHPQKGKSLVGKYFFNINFYLFCIDLIVLWIGLVFQFTIIIFFWMIILTTKKKNKHKQVSFCFEVTFEHFLNLI